MHRGICMIFNAVDISCMIFEGDFAYLVQASWLGSGHKVCALYVGMRPRERCLDHTMLISKAGSLENLDQLRFL